MNDWIEHVPGTGRPCPADTMVCILTDPPGGKYERMPAPAGDLIWEIAEGGHGRITHYRVVKEGANPLATQVGGGHYRDMPIQPVEFIHANALGYFEGNVVKYVSRWRNKGGVADLEKAKHYIDLLIKLETEAHAPDN